MGALVQRDERHSSKGSDMRVCHWALMVVMLAPAISSAQSTFNGTWRPNYSPTDLGKPVTSLLADGSYACQGCDHPYKIKADGRDQPVPAHPNFDTISATIVNPRTLKLVAKKNGRVIAKTIVTVSADALAALKWRRFMTRRPCRSNLRVAISGWAMARLDQARYPATGS